MPSDRVIVIGVRIRGLTAGALLAHRGYSVLILDQALVSGGKDLWLVGDSTYPGEGTAGVSYSTLTVDRGKLKLMGRRYCSTTIVKQRILYNF